MRYSIKVSQKTLSVRAVVMRSFLIFAFIFLTFGTTDVLAQHGGKAEPTRIQFAPGKTSTTLAGLLSNGQEMEYAFRASKGQTVTIRNANKNLFDFRVFSDENDFETEYESSPTLTFEVPATGDYMFFVRKKQVRKPRTARFSLTLAIK